MAVVQRRGRSSDFRAAFFLLPRLLALGNGLCGFVPGYSGGAVLESHEVPGVARGRLPLLRRGQYRFGCLLVNDRRDDVSEDKTISLDHFTDSHRDLCAKDRRRHHNRVKFAVLAAGIDLRRQVGQQLLVV